ncbi:hypothetical protein [Sulfuricurvum sp.]|uniref:hypothetical protein n=1 Tax=Sulfuricurvum sp. TaxID=2025608 RepID=UPI003BB4DCEF
MKKIVLGLVIFGFSAFAEDICSNKIVLALIQKNAKSLEGEIISFGTPISVAKISETNEICKYQKMVVRTKTIGTYVVDWTFNNTLDYKRDWVQAELIQNPNEPLFGR